MTNLYFFVVCSAASNDNGNNGNSGKRQVVVDINDPASLVVPATRPNGYPAAKVVSGCLPNVSVQAQKVVVLALTGGPLPEVQADYFSELSQHLPVYYMRYAYNLPAGQADGLDERLLSRESRATAE